MHFWRLSQTGILVCSSQSTRLYMISICPLTEDDRFDHQIKVVSTRFLLLKVTPFLFVMNSTLKLCNTWFFVEFSIYCLSVYVSDFIVIHFYSIHWVIICYLTYFGASITPDLSSRNFFMLTFIFFWHALIIFNTSLLPGIIRSPCIFPALILECPSCKDL